MSDLPTWERVKYELPEASIARITLTRTDRRNAQDYQLLYELDEAFQVATADEAGKGIRLAADGPA